MWIPGKFVCASTIIIDTFYTYRTDGIIQKAIHNTFSESTVLVIAHRLDTIMDSDKIMVSKLMIEDPSMLSHRRAS